MIASFCALNNNVLYYCFVIKDCFVNFKHNYHLVIKTYLGNIFRDAIRFMITLKNRETLEVFRMFIIMLKVLQVKNDLPLNMLIPCKLCIVLKCLAVKKINLFVI